MRPLLLIKQRVVKANSVSQLSCNKIKGPKTRNVLTFRRSSNLEDTCSGMSTMEGPQFYFMVTAHKDVHDAEIRIHGYNLKDVEEVTGQEDGDDE